MPNIFERISRKYAQVEQVVDPASLGKDQVIYNQETGEEYTVLENEQDKDYSVIAPTAQMPAGMQVTVQTVSDQDLANMYAPTVPGSTTEEETGVSVSPSGVQYAQTARLRHKGVMQEFIETDKRTVILPEFRRT